MSNIDCMKVIGVLSKTLKMEAIDIQYPDKSTDKLEVIMGAPSMQEKKFIITIKEFTLELSFPGDYFSPKEFEKWRSKFEYELEQAFLRNVSTRIDATTARHVVTLTF